MKIALDPYMHRHLPLTELPRLAAELGYEDLELSPRADFLDWFVYPRAYPERVQAFKASLRDHGVQLASLLPMYRWASPDEAERQAAMRHRKVTIEIAVELGCNTMNSESGRGLAPGGSGQCSCCSGHTVETCEAAFSRSMDELAGSQARVHQHLNIGQDEVDWDTFLGTLHEVGFDGIMTSCVFAGEERVVESSRFMRQQIQRYVDKYWGAA